MFLSRTPKFGKYFTFAIGLPNEMDTLKVIYQMIFYVVTFDCHFLEHGFNVFSINLLSMVTGGGEFLLERLETILLYMNVLHRILLLSCLSLGATFVENRI